MMVNIAIDGQKVMVDGHMTVLEAARKLGIYIPTFCEHRHLSHLGACRMCLVEVEGMGKLQTACTLAVGEGMAVRTDTPRVEKARRNILEYLLINHPLECTVCDASGECTLQDYTFKYGSAETRFRENKRVLRDHIISPLIDRNLNRCIQCKRCVRVCDEVQGVTALGMSDRGASTVVGPFMEKALDCEFCAHCIWFCPVGAITSRVMKHKVRTWEMDKVEAVCPFCSVGCALNYNSRDNKMYKVTHAQDRGINDGSLCSRGYFGYDVVNHPERLKTPMVRREGHLVPATWEEAFGEIASRLAKTVAQHGPSSVGGIASNRLTNEELYLFQKLFRLVIGTNNIDVPSGVWTRIVLPILEERLGVFAATNSLDELQYADAVLLVGSDITVDNPIAGLKIKAAIRRGARVIEIMPHRTALSRLAHRTLATPVGREIAILKGMMRFILDKGLANEKALKSYKGFDRLRRSVTERTTDEVAEMTGVDRDGIEAAAREFLSARRASVVFGPTAALQAGGRDLVSALVDLMILTGHMGQEGCGLYPVLPDTNFQGAVDMGVSPYHLPGHAPLGDSAAAETLAAAWKKPLPTEPGLTAHQMLTAARDGRIKALYLVGVNPLVSFPNGKMVEEALSKVPLLVVQELFLTETAQLAHVVLPAATLVEKNGTLTSVDRRIQRTRKALDAVGRAMPDWRIFSELGVAMGEPGLKYVNSAEVLEEIAEVIPYYSGISYRILADNGLQWPFSREDARTVYHEGYLGTRHLLAGGLPAERRAFAAPERWGGSVRDERYPFTMVVGGLLFHSGTFTRYSESLNKLVSSASVRMHPDTAGKLGVEDTEKVKVVSPHGEIIARVKVNDQVLPGTLFLPRHFAGTPVSSVTGMDGDAAETAVLRVRVERI